MRINAIQQNFTTVNNGQNFQKSEFSSSPWKMNVLSNDVVSFKGLSQEELLKKSVTLMDALVNSGMASVKNDKRFTELAEINKKLEPAVEYSKSYEDKLIRKMDETSGMRWETTRNFLGWVKEFGRSQVMEDFICYVGRSNYSDRATAIKVFTEDREFKKHLDLLYNHVLPDDMQEYEKLAFLLKDNEILYNTRNKIFKTSCQVESDTSPALNVRDFDPYGQ